MMREGCTVPQNEVLSLRLICMHYVANHITRVESLVDFPEAIGHELCQRVVSSGSLQAPDKRAEIVVRLFTEAYRELVVNSLDVRGRHIGLENCVDLLLTLGHLQYLNLAQCKLGADHTLLTQIFTSFKYLQSLGLQDNSLTDSAIQKLTSSLRILDRGPKSLHTLDLSCNPKLTDGCLKYLRCLETITTLDISGSAISDKGVVWFAGCMKLKCQRQDVPLVFLKTNGWMAPLLEKWLDHQPSKKRKVDKSNPSHFYSRSYRQQLLVKSIPAKICPPRDPVILFHSIDNLGKTPDPPKIVASSYDQRASSVSQATSVAVGEFMPRKCYNFRKSEDSLCNSCELSEEDKKMMLSYL